VYDMLSAQLERELVRLRSALTVHLTPMNAILKGNGLPEIVPKAVDVPAPAPPRIVP
jgi:hypothetical protein